MTDMSIRDLKLQVYDFGDTIHVRPGDSINDAYDKTTSDKNRCLLIHLAAATLCAESIHDREESCSAVTIPGIMRRASEFRTEQYKQAKLCESSLGEPTNNDPLVVAELRHRVHDVLNANHDRGHRALLCFPLTVMQKFNICIVRVSRSCRLPIHLISATQSSDGWVYLAAYQEHMGLWPSCVLPMASVCDPPQKPWPTQRVGNRSCHFALLPCPLTVGTCRGAHTVNPPTCDSLWESCRESHDNDRPPTPRI